MSVVRDTLERLLDADDLTASEAEQLVASMTSGQEDSLVLAALLAAIRTKGETAEEVRGFARGMRNLARRPELDATDACDVVGTGGDGSGSLNLSTGGALLAAAAGVPVVKHGNRSMSSRSGSADVLEALGVPMPLDEDRAGRLFREIGFTFLYAPYYHPAIGAVVPVRKSLGTRTIFNLLGPLTNPGAPGYAVIGAWSLDAARLMAHAIAGTEMKRAFVCHGINGWDEPTPISPFHLLDVSDGTVTAAVRDPLDAGISRCLPEDLAGGDPEANADSLRSALGGTPGAHRDAVMIGAALALEVHGDADDFSSGLAMAAAAIDDGRATSLIASLGGLSDE